MIVQLRGSAQIQAHQQQGSGIWVDRAEEALGNYFANLNGQKPNELYTLVMSEVEAPLFKTVMHYTGGNQSRAAQILGINRGTLRKKLRTYGLLG